jgi:2-polyprenyl-3-methyl-5-hydroxy-6-metoxy-1,4-benzoquinol methylase
VDHNVFAVEHVRRAGLPAETVDEFRLSPDSQFDSILFAHILEHMTRPEALQIVRDYLPHLRVGGTVLVICPQERGFASDATHVWFATPESLIALMEELGLTLTRTASFPFPRGFGKTFIYNETWIRATLQDALD